MTDTDTSEVIIVETLETLDIPTQQLMLLQQIAFDFNALLVIIGVLIGLLVAYTICKIVEKVINYSIF